MENIDKNHIKKQGVHKVLAHSYMLYLLFFLLSVCLDVFYRFEIFGHPVISSFGALFLFFGTCLIFWAQKTSRSLKKEIINKDTFMHGPYRFTRAPTHLGLFLLMFGFGVVTNAFFVVLFAFIYFIIAKLVFLNKEENMLVEKYGTPYVEYKKSVKF